MAIGARARHLTSVDSTNAEALRLAQAGEEGPLWIWADVQEQGRGRRGRRWDSAAGNLYATLLVTLDALPGQAASLSLAAPLAVLATVNDFLTGDMRARLKWPNDVLLAGRKVAGILVESLTTTCHNRYIFAIGCGLNLRHAPASSRYGATSLSNHGAAASPACCAQGAGSGNGTRPVPVGWRGRSCRSLRRLDEACG